LGRNSSEENKSLFFRRVEKNDKQYKNQINFSCIVIMILIKICKTILMRTLLTITIVFLLTACRKTKPEFDGVNCSGNCYVLTGKVIDTPSNIGLKGVELKFYYRPPGYALFWDPTRYLGNTTSNSIGEYKFQFDGIKYKTGVGYYKIQASKNGYFYDPLNQNDVKIFYLDSSQFNLPLKQDFALFRPATLTVRFRATTITNFEFLTFSYYYAAPGTGIILNGRRTIDTTITFKTAGDINTIVQWNAAGNGVNIRRSDTLFTTSGGNILYQINL
jgi:hypothetical protein